MAMLPRKATSIDSYLATRVRGRRVTLGVPLQELSEIIGVTYQQIQKYEKGVDRISASQLYEIACALNTPVADFYKGFGQERQSAAPYKWRQLEIARNFVEIQNEKHRVALCELVRTLAGR